MLMNQKILCMYSGGLDSAGVLYRLLTGDEFADYVIHVHHMHVITLENRAPAEDMAVRQTLKMMKGDGFRPFLYTRSLHRYDFMRQPMIWEMDLCAFMAGNICVADPAIRHVALGRTKTDIETGGQSFVKRTERAQTVFETIISLDDVDPGYIFPVLEMSKREVWDMLPVPIREATWSCRRPVYDAEKQPTACCTCPTCRKRSGVEE